MVAHIKQLLNTNLILWVVAYCGIVPGIASDEIIAIYKTPAASRTTLQKQQWFQVNAVVVDIAQNGARPVSTYILTHMELVQRLGSTVYKGGTVLNISQLATFSGTFSTGNIITFVINGTTVAINFDTDNSTTYNDILTALKAAFPDAQITVDPIALTVYIYQAGVNWTMACSIAGGTPPTVVITAPYSKADTTIYYIEKVVLYLQAYGEGSNNYLQKLQQSLFLADTIAFLDSVGIAYIKDESPITDIHLLIDETFEERFSYDLQFSIGQTLTDISYEIDNVSLVPTITNS